MPVHMRAMCLHGHGAHNYAYLLIVVHCTQDTHPATSERNEKHKVFHASFRLILQLGLPEIFGEVPPAVF